MRSPWVLHHGGGTNSTALAIELYRRGVRPDAILFSDTKAEKPETYTFIERFDKWLQHRNFPGITIVKANGVDLETDCLTRETLPSVAFGFKTCSQRWKTQPQDKWINSWPMAREAWAEGGKVVKMIGYDAGERHRVKDYNDDKFIVTYPLVDWGDNRQKCVEIVKSKGFNPGKSSCFFCPNMRKWEVLALAKSHPDLIQRALAMEANAKSVTTVAGLGRSYSWTGLIKQDAEQLRLFPVQDEAAEEMPCGCYDGAACETPVTHHAHPPTAA